LRVPVLAACVGVLVGTAACGSSGGTATTLSADTVPTTTSTTLPPGVGRSKDAAGYQMTPIKPDHVDIPEGAKTLGNLYTLLASKDGAQIAFVVRGTLPAKPGTAKEAKAAIDDLLKALGGGGPKPPKVQTVDIGGPKVELVETPEGKTVVGTITPDGSVSLWIGADRDAIVEMLKVMASTPTTTAPPGTEPPPPTS